MSISEGLLPKDEAVSLKKREVLPIPARHTLIMPSIDTLIPYVFDKKMVSGKPELVINHERFNAILMEHFEIYALLASLLGGDSVNVIQTAVTMGKKGELKDFEYENYGPDAPYTPVEFPYLGRFKRSWPRDAFTYLDGNMHVEKAYWTVDHEDLLQSPLGEGGKVLVKGDAMVVTPDVYAKRDQIPTSLSGRKMVQVPLVDQSFQRHEFVDTHIDGHLALVEGKGGKLGLFVAKSYAGQGKGTMKSLRYAADQIGAEIFTINDYRMPFLALNLLQFDNGMIAMTSGAEELENKLKDFVGEDKVATTRVPIEVIPTRAGGSIRCLTNILPPLDWLDAA